MLELVFSCLNNVRGQAACDALGSELWNFATNHKGCVDRSIRRLARVASYGPYKPLLRKWILARCIAKSASGRAEHEETKKKKWALQLAGYIEDAKLPAAERIKAMSDRILSG